LRPLAEQLTALYRDTLLATDFYGKNMNSSAAELNVSVSAVKSGARRGRIMLKHVGMCHVDVSGTGGVLDFRFGLLREQRLCPALLNVIGIGARRSRR
jgi:RNA polymerase sigma-70 factor, ECF subfamily